MHADLTLAYPLFFFFFFACQVNEGFESKCAFLSPPGSE